MDPLIISEVNGLGRGILLVGNSRPFQPLELGVEQRVQTDYYAGNPVAFQRITGPTFTPTIITGRWDDKKMRVADQPTLIGFGELLTTVRTVAGMGEVQASAGDAGGSKARNTAELAAVFESLCRSGSKLKVQWERHVRFGRLKRFVPSWRNRFHCTWEAEFVWSGDSEDQPVPQAPIPNVAGFAANVAKWIKLILSQLDVLANLPTLRLIEVGIGELNTLAAEVISDLNLVTETILAPAESLASVRSSYERLRVQCQAIIDDLALNTAGLRESEQRDASGGAISSATAMLVQRYLEILMEESMLRQAEINAVLEKDRLTTFVVPDYMGLRDVAIMFYGSPENWLVIAEHNNISGSVVEPGAEISIPKLT